MTDTVAVRHESQSFLQGRPSGGQAPPFHGGHGIVNLSHRGRLQKSVADGSASENAKRACRPAPKSGDRKEERRAELVNVTMPCGDLLQSRTDEAVVWLERARSASPGRPIPRASLAPDYRLTSQREP